MDIEKYYVYIYFDTRKSGKFVYGGYQFDYKPFYVGKGKEGRGEQYLSHLRKAKNFDLTKKYDNPHKINKIKKMLDERFEPVIIKFKENLLEQEAFDLEKDLIKVIGREKFGGPLTNILQGGEGYGDINLGKIPWNKGKTKENDPRVARIAEKLRGRTKENHPGVGRQAEKIKGRTKENDLSVARMAKKLRGRTKETHSGLARQAEKMKIIKIGKTKENDLGVARQAEKMKGNTNGAKTFKIIFPDKKEIIVTNLDRFCRENGLDRICMYDVENNRRKSYKGFRVKKWR
ncbi:MAG TPA: hypothetical protein VMZ91_03425 [Candidatus Paceibacterota bacterium]|nr:hypothetical protein [Candidatus Paceibacterota bacterium]